MPRAVCLIRDLPHYRRDAFVAGLARAGYTLSAHASDPRRGDLLVTWNRYGTNEVAADAWEAAGGFVLVAENGYVGADRNGHQLYALGIGGHNDPAGVYVPPGGYTADRLRETAGVELAPWRIGGAHVLVAPNRSFGRRGRIMPPDWAQAAVAAIHARGRVAIRVRPHPGNNAPPVPLEHDLAEAGCVVVWSSSVGVAALVAGIPVIACAPAWIGMAAAGKDPAEALTPPRPATRELAAAHIGWGQWTLDEIASGAAFRHFARPFEEMLDARERRERRA